MDNSTENVTLYAVFVQDVLKQFDQYPDEQAVLRKFGANYDIDSPFNAVPIQIYNDMCAWVETEKGVDHLVSIGKNIGETVYTALIENSIISPDASPEEIIDGLIIAAESMIQDEKNRGWVKMEVTPHSIQMKRTQTFNSKLQLGLLAGLVGKSGVSNVQVKYLARIDDDDEFDIYEISWQS